MPSRTASRSRKTRMLTKLIAAVTLSTLCLLPPAYSSLSAAARAQAPQKSDYGANLTIAVYQYDDARSKEIREVTILGQTVSSAEEEIEYLARTYGLEDLKPRHIRAIGLRESESFTDSQPMNERQLVFTVTPRVVTREGMSLDVVASYDGQPLLEAKAVKVGNYETVMLRGGRGDFGVREFIGPGGATERAPEKRALLITITPTIIATRGLQNRPADLSRPTTRYGAPVRLNEGDVFIMPSVILRVLPKFSAGSKPKGSITLEGIITPDGSVTNVRVYDTPDPAYNARAIEAFRQYRFNPALLNGQLTYASYRETIVFTRPGPL
jgi:TonB family protein